MNHLHKLVNSVALENLRRILSGLNPRRRSRVRGRRVSPWRRVGMGVGISR